MYVIILMNLGNNDDANNSGIPTSQTPTNKDKRTPNSREKGEKEIGGQFGHKKHMLPAFPDDEINEHIHHEQTICECCQSQMQRTGEERTKDEYEIEVVVKRRRHHFHETKCPNCETTDVAKIPNNLKEESQYGAGIDALILSLLNIGFVSMSRTKELITGFTAGEVSLSVGYIAKVQLRVAKQLGSLSVNWG